MTPRILVCCFEVPTQGGAATSAYALAAKMQRDGHDAHYLNVVERAALPYYTWTYGTCLGNPDGLPDVHTAVVEHPFDGIQPALRDTIARIAPDVIVARGYLATLFAKRAAPERPVVFSTAGSQQAEFLVGAGLAAQAIDLPALVPHSARRPPVAPGNEAAALDAADLVLANSDAVGDTLRTFFDLGRSCKVHPETIWSVDWVVDAVAAAHVRRKPFADRAIDVLACASSWSRPEKNLAALRRIVARLGGARVVIAGECRDPVEGAEHVGFVEDRRAVFALMADAKVVVSVSLVDACPTTLFEAAFLGCNVVASRNCGNWRVCPDVLLVDPPDDGAYVAAIRRGLAHEYPGDLDWFLRTRSYERLIEIVTALAE